MKPSTCYLNGEMCALEDAKISVLDRGFIFGDGIYEVIPVFAGIPFRLNEHLSRLNRSLAAVSIENPLLPDQWVDTITDLIDRNGAGDQSIYLQITRGVAPRNHVPTSSTTPTVFMMSNSLATSNQPEGINVVTTEDFRWSRCDIKTTSLLANVMARESAAREGSGEAIFVREGVITEGAASNVFICHESVVITPGKSPEILPGVTRDLLLELLENEGISCHEKRISYDEFLAADEVWITSSSREMVPVLQINNRAVGNGAIGPMFTRVLNLYQQFKQTYISARTT